MSDAIRTADKRQTGVTLMHLPIGPTLLCIAAAVLLPACGGGTDNGPDCRFDEAWENGLCNVEITIPPVTIPDGIWRGVDSGGRPVSLFVNRFGAFHFVDGLGNQAAGELAVSNGESVTSSLQLVTPLRGSFADGTTLANCTFSGSLVQRVSMTITEHCTTTAGLVFAELLVVSFDPLYLRTASLGMIAGSYRTPLGSSLNITSDGVLFAQDPASSCVTNGQVRTIVSFANLYFIDYDVDNCAGPATIWNGSSFSGLAFLDNTHSPESFEYAVVGELGGVPVSVVVTNDRI